MNEVGAAEYLRYASGDVKIPSGTLIAKESFTVTGNDGWIAATVAIAPAGGGGSTYYYVTDAYDTNWTSVYSNEDACC